mgnify:CR=1 FL=1
MIRIFQALLSKFFKAFMWALLKLLASKIGTAAENIVAMANDLEAKKDWTGSEKASALKASLKSIAISTGKEATTETVHLAIETAVNIIKGK